MVIYSRIMNVLLLLVLSVLSFSDVVWCNDNTSSGDLIFATVIYRHGDRTPLGTYPNDPWGNLTNWPVRFGQLSNLGKQQHYELGQWLRHRYTGNLISERYDETEIYIQSSDTDRCVMSAAVNLASMFPPKEDQMWKNGFIWQPIPIHTIPEALDNILKLTKSCPAYDYHYKQLLMTQKFIDIDAKYKSLYEYLSNNTGSDIRSIRAINKLYDTLWVQTQYNKTLPEWTNSVFPEGDFKDLSDIGFALPTYTPQLKRLKHGVLLKNILDRFMSKATHTQQDQAMVIYSAHDSTLSGLLNVLGLFEKPHCPPYASSLLFELRQNGKDSLVQVFYKKGAAAPALMEIPGCGTSCPLSTMYQIYSDVMPTRSFDEECKLSDDLM